MALVTAQIWVDRTAHPPYTFMENGDRLTYLAWLCSTSFKFFTLLSNKNNWNSLHISIITPTPQLRSDTSKQLHEIFKLKLSKNFVNAHKYY
jgi:hypothetical protein